MPRVSPNKYAPLAKLDALEKSAAHLNEPFYPLPINVNFDKLPGDTNHVGVEQHPCVGCGDCMTGCNYRAKNTVLMNYLPDAKNHNAEIFTEVSVRYLERKDNRWLVHYQLLQTGREKFDAPTMFVSADIVVLGAGTFGSTEILLRSKHRANGLSMSDKVGERFTGNGDVLGFAYNCEEEINGIGFGHRPVEGRKKVGPTITGIIDMRKKPRLEDSFVIEDGAIAGAFSSLLPAIFATAAKVLGKDTDSGFKDESKEQLRELESLTLGAHRGALRNTQTFLVMAHDDGQGRLYLDDDRLRISWPQVSSQPIFAKVEGKLKESTEALGGTYVKNPVSNQFMGQDLITVHPLGGCAMAEHAGEGVVNHKGQVFSGPTGTSVYQNLYVNDGSVIPRSIGVNPLLTISAIAERCCSLLAARSKVANRLQARDLNQKRRLLLPTSESGSRSRCEGIFQVRSQTTAPTLINAGRNRDAKQVHRSSSRLRSFPTICNALYRRVIPFDAAGFGDRKSTFSPAAHRQQGRVYLCSRQPTVLPAVSFPPVRSSWVSGKAGAESTVAIPNGLDVNGRQALLPRWIQSNSRRHRTRQPF